MERTELTHAGSESAFGHRTNRRSFLKTAGAGTAGAALFTTAGCDLFGEDSADAEVIINMALDLGVLNFAYLLEQLEAAFYARVAADSLGSAITDPVEVAYFEDLADHEAIHRNFLKAAITSIEPDGALPDVPFDFSSVDFGSRDVVLTVSQQLEDTGVSAYNGAGIYLSNPDFITLAGKIVSVEARHAAAIRNLIDPFSTNFADLTDPFLTDLFSVPENALDVAAGPAKVLQDVIDTGFLDTTIDLINAQLPDYES